ncbi:hypothetical protein [Candidatus Arthromitus sp. SFB-turkey]|uniref:hypothetical protein n=1 Tax=Candidatus Arthromitus sp. SFB-turkey TaxID=1840217 RepID=UPI0007F4EDD5|nr:hypothetical protein [Candidatus Arthromitus sp. SFB-turkey]OAT89995.1 hypothetical protein A6P36_06975 [Candidatus Arthromitus sp. SFB-turkey]
MGNVSGNGKENTLRKKVLKKAAMLATVASITGACAVGGQKPKESEALIGAIIMAIVAGVTTAASIGQSVYETESAKNMQNQAVKEQKRQEEEARKQAEEARKQAEREAEEARIQAALEDPNYNVRLQEQDEEEGKTIDMSSADNSAVLEQQQQEAMARARRRNSIKRPTAPPKDVNVGGFGVEEEVEEVVTEDIVNNEEEVVEEVVTEDIVNNEEEVVEEIVTEDIVNNEEEIVEEVVTEDIVNNEEEVVEDIVDDDVSYTDESYEEFVESDSESNIVRLSLKDVDFGSDEFNGVIEQITTGGDYVEVDEDMLMSEKDAQNHRLVEEGFLSAEEIILLDFGIRNGTINEDVLNSMYESGEVSDEYYEGAMELLFEIYEELSN